MKLSEIISLPDEERNNKYYGVEVDEESIVKPEGLEEIAFLYKSDNGQFDPMLMDAIIAYRYAQADVILEIEIDDEDLDVPYMINFASNADFSIAVLPPKDPAYYDKFLEVNNQFIEAYFKLPNYSKFVYPLSSYLEYMFAETVTDVSEYKAQDPYILERFVSRITPEFEDKMKAEMRKKIFEIFESEENFRAFAHSVMWKIYKQTETNIIESSKQNNQDQDEQNIPETE